MYEIHQNKCITTEEIINTNIILKKIYEYHKPGENVPGIGKNPNRFHTNRKHTVYYTLST